MRACVISVCLCSWRVRVCVIGVCALLVRVCGMCGVCVVCVVCVVLVCWLVGWLVIFCLLMIYVIIPTGMLFH